MDNKKKEFEKLKKKHHIKGFKCGLAGHKDCMVRTIAETDKDGAPTGKYHGECSKTGKKLRKDQIIED